jgi:hypothetical protein
MVRACTNSSLADLMQQFHPLRLQYEAFSNANPLMGPVAGVAEQVRDNRRPVAADNPFIAIQEAVSKQIVAGLDAWRDFSEAAAERLFMATYGSAALQAAVGIDPASTAPLRQAPKSPLHRELMEKRIAELKSQMKSGGVREAAIRALIFVGLDRAAIDERGFEAVRRIRQTLTDLPLSAFKATVREQFELLLIDTEAALAAIPSLLPEDAGTRQKAFDLVCQVLSARGEYSDQDLQRLERLARLFHVDGPSHQVRSLAPAADDLQPLRAKAS